MVLQNLSAELSEYKGINDGEFFHDVKIDITFKKLTPMIQSWTSNIKTTAIDHSKVIGDDLMLNIVQT